MSLTPFEQAIAGVHTLSSAAWFGALVYRTFFVDRKALRFFGAGADYERFSLELAHGMRYVVLLALLICGLSGFVLVGLRWQSSGEWLWLICGKTALWVIAFALFGYISWVYWPRRVFADATEWSALRRQGVLFSLVMIGIAATGIVLGQLGQALHDSWLSQ